MTHRTPHILKPLLVRQWGQRYPQRPSQDTALLKTLAEQLSNTLPRSPACMHLRGNGGLKQAICSVQAALPKHCYVFRTDVKSYYASINHHRLMDQLADHVTDRDSLNLLWQYMRRTVEYGGTFREIPCGIPAGCSLSPLIGAFHLHGLDVEMTRQHRGCFYIRYMDDILILAPSRWRLRRAIAAVKRHLDGLGLELHPDKTSIGPIARGFDFLGYHHDRSGLRLSAVTLARHHEKLTRLYERYQRYLRAHRIALIGQSTIPRPERDPARAYLNPRPQITSHRDIVQRLEAYKRRFAAWAQGGLNICETGRLD
jgi:RNA-directed DNA polymerase